MPNQSIVGSTIEGAHEKPKFSLFTANRLRVSTMEACELQYESMKAQGSIIDEHGAFQETSSIMNHNLWLIKRVPIMQMSH